MPPGIMHSSTHVPRWRSAAITGPIIMPKASDQGASDGVSRNNPAPISSIRSACDCNWLSSHVISR